MKTSSSFIRENDFQCNAMMTLYKTISVKHRYILIDIKLRMNKIMIAIDGFKGPIKIRQAYAGEEIIAMIIKQ